MKKSGKFNFNKTDTVDTVGLNKFVAVYPGDDSKHYYYYYYFYYYYYYYYY